jgi:hypothetical protein
LISDDLLFSVFEKVQWALGVKCGSWRFLDFFSTGFLYKLGNRWLFTEIGAIVEFGSEILFVKILSRRVSGGNSVLIKVELISLGLVDFIFRFIMGRVEFFVEGIYGLLHSLDSFGIVDWLIIGLLGIFWVESFFPIGLHDLCFYEIRLFINIMMKFKIK